MKYQFFFFLQSIFIRKNFIHFYFSFFWLIAFISHILWLKQIFQEIIDVVFSPFVFSLMIKVSHMIFFSLLSISLWSFISAINLFEVFEVFFFDFCLSNDVLELGNERKCLDAIDLLMFSFSLYRTHKTKSSNLCVARI